MKSYCKLYFVIFAQCQQFHHISSVGDKPIRLPPPFTVPYTTLQECSGTLGNGLYMNTGNILTNGKYHTHPHQIVQCSVTTGNTPCLQSCLKLSLTIGFHFKFYLHGIVLRQVARFFFIFFTWSAMLFTYRMVHISIRIKNQYWSWNFCTIYRLYKWLSAPQVRSFIAAFSRCAQWHVRKGSFS